MSCEHATTTTLLWCFGESDPDHVLHVSGCAECQAVVAEQSTVVELVAPVAPALATSAATRRWRPLAVGLLLAIAASTLLLLRPAMPQPAALLPATPLLANGSVQRVELVPALLDDPVDLALDELDAELDALSLDMINL